MLRFTVLTLALMLGTHAGIAQDGGDCGHPVPERSIRGCSALLEQQETRATPRETAKLYVRRGEAQVIVGAVDEAARDLHEALGLNDSDDEAHLALGDVYYRKGDFERAIAHYERAIDINFDNSAACRAAGRLQEAGQGT
jgi:tetratricopeptide (TPR) repeat protein